MFLFAHFALCRRPIVVVPPMFGSVLYGNIYNLKTHWYCKSTHTNEWIWLTDKYLVPPVANCLGNYVTCAINETTGKPGSRPEAEIWTIDFGGDKAIRYLDPGLFKHHIIPLMYKALDRFVAGGYSIKVDMFGAPYDWRMNPVSLDQYWIDLKGLCETAYTQNDNTPIALFGFSAGNYVIHQFLTKYVTEEWRNQHVSRAIMLGPSFPGSFEAVKTVWLGKMAFMPSLYDTKDLNDMTLSIPTLYAHLPNAAIWGDRKVVYGPNGEEYTAAQLYDLYKEHNRIPEEFLPIYESALPYINGEIGDIGVDTYFIFNGILETTEAISFPDGWDKKFHEINGTGDSTINAFGLYYGCNNWNPNMFAFVMM